MKFVLDILKDRLRTERVCRAQAQEWLDIYKDLALKGKIHLYTAADVNAFEESLRLAHERIPQLVLAIDELEKLKEPA
jgi:hypothetical protein